MVEKVASSSATECQDRLEAGWGGIFVNFVYFRGGPIRQSDYLTLPYHPING